MLVLPTLLYSQGNDSLKKDPIGMYFSGSVSLSAIDHFGDGTYPSLEAGISYKYFCFGLNAGRGRLTDIFSQKDRSSEYYWEVKSTVSYPIERIKLYLVFAYGQYFTSRNSLIEYGGGFSYPIKNFDLGLQMSSFDGVAYVSPCITYNIQFRRN